jgi:tRNA nucleotidyltransferase/poly(A) polymerase
MELLGAEAVRAAAAPIAGLFAGVEAWLAGGAVRELLCGRSVSDWDVAVAGDPGAAARALGRRTDGVVFQLSERHGAWRVVRGAETIDLTPLSGSIDDDLRRRDFTINAIALDLADGTLVDPTGGVADLEAALLRPVSERIFADDPLRLMRLVRLAAELRLEVGAEAAALATRAAHRAGEPAGERLLAELGRILGSGDPAGALGLADRLGVLAAVLPELVALHGVEQSAFHHLDVFEHTLHVVDSTADVATHLDHYLGPAAAAVDAALARPLDGTLDVRAALRFAALLHDIAKPQTRVADAHGWPRFVGHDAEGALLARTILTRLRASGALAGFCAVLVREHLRLGFLVNRRPLDARAIHRYAVATAPYTEASIVLSVGDRLATRGQRTRQRGLRRHLELARELAAAHAALGPPPPPPLRGDELARRLGLAPGPVVGQLVAALAEEQAAGAVESRADAERFAREWLEERGGASGRDAPSA